MATTLTVEYQSFVFDASWLIAFKYDDTTFYQRKVKDKLSETKAVDVVAGGEEQGLLLMEVKDFRGYRIQNKKRLNDAEITLEVAQKVRDTISGLTGAKRGEEKEFDSKKIHGYLHGKKKIVVILWLEDDDAVNLQAWKPKMDVLNQKIKAHLGWLGPVRTYVMGSWLPAHIGVTVTDLQRKV